MPSNRIARVADRALSRFGEDATITNYSDSGTTDDYNDPIWDESTVETTAYFARPREEPRPVATGAGEVVGADAEIHVPDDVTVNETTRDSASRASEVTRDRTGEKFRVMEVWDQNNGLQKLMCEEIDR